MNDFRHTMGYPLKQPGVDDPSDVAWQVPFYPTYLFTLHWNEPFGLMRIDWLVGELVNTWLYSK
jgi:hypothetical protein